MTVNSLIRSNRAVFYCTFIFCFSHENSRSDKNRLFQDTLWTGITRIMYCELNLKRDKARSGD